MSKKLFLIMIFLISSLYLFAETIFVAPMIIYDKDSNIIEQTKNPSEEIFERISMYWFEGLVTFKNLSAKKYGEIYTTLDANRCCAAENADCILFGYVQKNESNWIANMKLYDYKTKKISKEFYSGDDIFHYERLFDNLSKNILTGLEEVIGLNHNEILKEKLHPLEIKLPISAFYWCPIDGKWNLKMIGIAGGDMGIQIYPPQPKIIVGQFLIDFSLRPEFSYSYAMGKDNVYPLKYNAFSFVLPLCAHLHFDMNNSIYLGSGAYYEIELLKIKPKYEKNRVHYQNIFGLESFIGYESNLSKLINLFTEVRIDFHFNKDNFLAIKPVLGMSFNLFRQYVAPSSL